MRAFHRLLRSCAERTVALTTALALLSSALLAVGEHEHLGPQQLDVVCSVDHEQGAASRKAGVHAAAERPHRHHCASCQIAAKSTAESPADAAFDARPQGPAGLGAAVVLLERTPGRSAASPRGPPIY